LGEVVILAAGDFPRRGGDARRLLETAARVVCCDGAADAFRRRLGRDPDAVVGDGDSLKGRFPCVERVAEQETNDLEKAVRYCRARGWKNPIVVGATGKREDHTLGNVFRTLDLGVEIVTDFGRFTPFCGTKCFHTRKGQAVSVFAPDPETQMTSKGLEWPLDGVRFKNLHCATLNRATGARVTLTSTRRALVFVQQ